MPELLDLNFKPSASQPTLPTGGYPYVAPAIYRGDEYTIHFTLSDGVDPYTPEGTLTAQIRPARLAANATPGDPLAEFLVTVDGNEVTIQLDGDDTAGLPDAAYWDLEESFDDASPRTWFTGKVKVWGDVTREVGS